MPCLVLANYLVGCSLVSMVSSTELIPKIQSVMIEIIKVFERMMVFGMIMIGEHLADSGM